MKIRSSLQWKNRNKKKVGLKKRKKFLLRCLLQELMEIWSLLVLFRISYDLYFNICSFHRHKFFTGCWMNSNAWVEICLSSSHLHSHSKSLNNLIKWSTAAMQPYNSFIFWNETHQFHECLLFLSSRSKEGIDGAWSVHLDILLTIFLDSFILWEADWANGWMTEYYSRDIFIAHDCSFAIE